MANIYLINLENTDIYKIGVTNGDPNKRLKNLQVGSPYKLIFVKSFASTYGAKLEGILHRAYSAQKVSSMDGQELLGEWFELSNLDVKNFETRCESITKNLDIIKVSTTLDNFLS